MTDDLVKLLRELNTFEWHARPATTKGICFEAADRIEKLEAALKKIALDDPDCCMIADRMRETAEKALEGKDE